MNRPGPGQQPLRGISGFPSQQQPQTRSANASILSGRLPNGKIGTSPNWGFGLPMAGAPGLQNNQQRTVNAMGSFAQSVGGSQPATALDLSEFPSLSSGPQQNPASTPGQAIWGNTHRTTPQQQPQQPPQQQQQQQQQPSQQPQPPQQQQQQPPQPLGQRQPQAPIPSQAPSRASQTQSQQSQPQSHTSHDDLFPSATQFATQLDDFRNGVQGIGGKLPGSNQPQTGNIEEFPPLGKRSDLGGRERGEGLLPSGNIGTYGGSMAFSGLNQGPSSQIRSPLGNALNGQQDNARITSPSGAVGSAMSTSRQQMGQGQNGLLGQDQEEITTPSSIGNQRAARTETFPEQQQQQQTPAPVQTPHQQQQQPPATFGDDTQDPSGTGQGAEQTPLSQMSERDRFGLAGLLRMIHSESPDVAGLAIGQDLMSLGLDLNQPEPLHQSFASPFISSNASVPLQPDFTLPGCYNVANVQPLQTRIPSFSDETLFYIFYSMPRDLMQELVAEELMGRKWRYHKIERAWLTRDDSYPNPVEVDRGISERGVYLWWDTNTWKKVRREFILRYADLDTRLDPGRSLIRGVTLPQNT